MEKRDNAHAKGLSVNEDWIRDEDFTVVNEPGKIGISVDLTHATNKLQHELENMRSGLALTNPEE